MNTILPLGSTATYECAVCGNTFLLRSVWHLTVLSAVCVLYSWIVIAKDSLGLLTLLILILLVCYSAFAIGEHLWNAKQNPPWHAGERDA
jgi:hypothetical protein